MAKKTSDKKTEISLTGNLGPFNGTYELGTATSTSTGTYTLTNCFREEFRSAQFIEKEKGNFIEMVYEKVPTVIISSGWSFDTPKKAMIKKIYGVKNGKLQLVNTIEGIEEPAHYVEAIIEWKE